MKRSDAFPSRYLTQSNLPGPPGSTHTKIEDVRVETMPGDKPEEKPVMYFSIGTCADTGAPLAPMVVNGGNWDECERNYGDNSDNWRGKPVELYVDPTVTYAGKRTGGIRVRISNDSTNGWTLQEALDSCQEVGVSKDDLKAAIAKAGHSGWNAKRDTATAKQLIQAASGAGHEPVDEEDIPF